MRPFGPCDAEVGHRVVVGHLLHHAVPDAIAAAVSDVAEVEPALVAREARRAERGAHSLQLRLLRGLVEDGGVRHLDRARELGGGDGEVRVGLGLERARLERAADRLDRDPARVLAAAMATHAVRNHEDVVRLVEQEAVLVLLPTPSGIRLRVREENDEGAGRLLGGELRRLGALVVDVPLDGRADR